MTKILLDPGHSDLRDNRIAGYSEAKTVLAIAKKLKAYAETRHALTVDLTRADGRGLASDYAADLKARGRSAKGYALFLSLHTDAGGNPNTQGATLYGNIRPEKADPAFFARISSAVSRATGVPANAVRYREDSDPARYRVHPVPKAGCDNYYAVLRHAEADCSCLLELGFHTNKKERALLSDPNIQEAIAMQLAEAIAERYATGKKQDTNPAAFLERILPDVLQSAKQNRLLPSIILAQAMLESGHGTSELAKKGHNLFGIKASPPWTGAKLLYKGEHYRAYADPSASIRDHGAFFTSTPAREKRYAGVIGETDGQKAVRALGSSGYAQDAHYGEKLRGVIERYGLFAYDTIVQQTESCPCEWSISLLKRTGKHREVRK